MRQHFFIGRRFFRPALDFALEFVEGNKLIGRGLSATASHLHVAQDQRAFAVLLKKNEWIGREEPRCVKHIGIGFAGGDN